MQQTDVTASAKPTPSGLARPHRAPQQCSSSSSAAAAANQAIRQHAPSQVTAAPATTTRRRSRPPPQPRTVVCQLEVGAGRTPPWQSTPPWFITCPPPASVAKPGQPHACLPPRPFSRRTVTTVTGSTPSNPARESGSERWCICMRAAPRKRLPGPSSFPQSQRRWPLPTQTASGPDNPVRKDGSSGLWSCIHAVGAAQGARRLSQLLRSSATLLIPRVTGQGPPARASNACTRCLHSSSLDSSSKKQAPSPPPRSSGRMRSARAAGPAPQSAGNASLEAMPLCHGQPVRRRVTTIGDTHPACSSPNSPPP